MLHWGFVTNRLNVHLSGERGWRPLFAEVDRGDHCNARGPRFAIFGFVARYPIFEKEHPRPVRQQITSLTNWQPVHAETDHSSKPYAVRERRPHRFKLMASIFVVMAITGALTYLTIAQHPKHLEAAAGQCNSRQDCGAVPRTTCCRTSRWPVRNDDQHGRPARHGARAIELEGSSLFDLPRSRQK